MKNLISFIFFFLLINLKAYPYSYTLTTSGERVYWNSTSSNLYLYNNSSNYSDAVLGSIISSVLLDWNSSSPFQISTQTGSSIQNGRNDLYFSSTNSIFYGSGVAAVTQVLYDQQTSELIEADIIINDSILFDTSNTSSNYLGNVIAHELGHLAGLNHSSVNGATMFWQTSVGQHTLSNDDISGLRNLYASGSYGSIEGEIIGGDSLVGVFGAHVHAINIATGDVQAAAISDQDGSFKIGGLDSDEEYLIYTKPIEAFEDTLPSYYSSVRTNFCDGNKDYRGSFYQSCNRSENGYPKSIGISSSSLNKAIGQITIDCNINVNSNYFIDKNNFSLDLIHDSSSEKTLGNSFVGFFSYDDVIASARDKVILDLTSVDLTNDITHSESQLFLTVNMSAQKYFSKNKFNVTVTYFDSSTSNHLGVGVYSTDSDNKPNTDLVLNLPLSLTNSAENYFEIELEPEEYTSFLTNASKTISDFLPSYSLFEDDIRFYLLSASVTKKNSDGSYEPISYKSSVEYSDNHLCPKAENAYNVIGEVEVSSALSNSDDENGAISCGSIDGSSGPGGNLPSLVLGFLLSLLLVASKKKLVCLPGR